jgi:hypothetical protein
VTRLTCDERIEFANTVALGVLGQDAIAEIGDHVDGLDDLLRHLDSHGKIDTTQLQYEVVPREANEARVNISGRINVGLGDAAFAVPVNMAWKMVNVDGVWQWCGRID